MKRALALVLGLGLLSTPAFAQTHVGSTRPAQDRVGILAFGSYELVHIASTKTFDAVFGTSKVNALGAGIDVVNIWRHVFLRVAASRGTLDGERVAIVDSTVYKLGTTLTVDMTPTEVGAGWRFVSSGAAARFTPYVGVAGVFLKYQETSAFAQSGDNVSETYKGVGAFGGVDVRVTNQIFVGAEGQYRSINSNPSSGSAADSFNEKNLGGAVVRLKLGLRF